MNWIKSNGTATELYGGKLILVAALLFLFGALNNIGIGSYSLTMVTVYMLGLNPAICFSNYDGGLYLLCTCWQCPIC